MVVSIFVKTYFFSHFFPHYPCATNWHFPPSILANLISLCLGLWDFLSVLGQQVSPNVSAAQFLMTFASDDHVLLLQKEVAEI